MPQHSAVEDAVTGWVLEHDEANPGVRYFGLLWLMGYPSGHPHVVEAQQQVMRSGPVPKILDKQEPAGYWHRSDNLYLGGMKSTSTQLHLLANLGADGRDPRIQATCDLILGKSSTPEGGFSHTGTQSGVIHCLNGNMLRALILFGHLGDERVDTAIQWAAKTITGRGEPPFRKSSTTGPLFACKYNGGLPCAWGAVRELRALAAIPRSDRSDLVSEAIESGVEFLLSHDLVKADFPTSSSVSEWWTGFGFPTSYQTDLLELLFALIELGYGGDPRLQPAVEFVLSKRNEMGRWIMERSFNGRMYTSVERRGQPSKWVSLRAARVVQATASL